MFDISTPDHTKPAAGLCCEQLQSIAVVVNSRGDHIIAVITGHNSSQVKGEQTRPDDPQFLLVISIDLQK